MSNSSKEQKATCDGCGLTATARCPYCEALTCGDCATCEHFKELVRDVPDETLSHNKPELPASKKRSFARTEGEFLEHCKSRSIVTDRGCWEWQGSTENFRNIKPGQRGYPNANFRGKRVRLHRWSLARKLGRPIEPKMQAGHFCDNPPCWNPDHLYETTNQQNHLDGGKRKRMQGQLKTHCDSGHEFTPENTYWSKRGLSFCRNCKTCQRIRQRIRKQGWSPEEAKSLPPIPQGAVTARRTFQHRRKSP